MILFKKWAKHKVKSYIYCVNQFLRETRHKKWNRECKQKQYLLFNFCNSFDLLTSRTQKIAWWTPVFNLIFTYFSVMNNSGKIKEISSTGFYCIIHLWISFFNWYSHPLVHSIWMAIHPTQTVANQSQLFKCN